MIITIVAQSKNRVIGNNNQLIWHLPKDLKRFKQLTTGHPIVMGKNTFNSIGKALPNRKNIVISTTLSPQKDIVLVDSLKSGLEVAKHLNTTIYVIGGGQVYKESIYLSDYLEVTEVHCEVEGDTFFPEIEPYFWEEIKRESHKKDHKHLYDFDFVTYKRKRF